MWLSATKGLTLRDSDKFGDGEDTRCDETVLEAQMS